MSQYQLDPTLEYNLAHLMKLELFEEASFLLSRYMKFNKVRDQASLNRLATIKKLSNKKTHEKEVAVVLN